MTDVHYRDILKREYISRTRRNSGYSLRAFARDIGLQPSKLSELLNGHRGLSQMKAKEVATRLKLSVREQDAFLDLVNLHQTKNRALKEATQRKLSLEYGELDLERFKIIADWHHFAILELTETAGFKSDTRWIANRLGLKASVAREAIDRLLDCGLLEKTASGLKQTNANLATPSGIPSRELREHHSQILMKADEALQSTPVEERDFSAITLAFDSSQMDEVRKQLKDLRRKLGQTIQDGPTKDRVYCLSIQFFPLDTDMETSK